MTIHLKIQSLLFTILLVVACSKSEIDNGGSQEKPKQPEITLNATSADFSTDGGSDEITFTSSVAWTAEVVNSRADAWCSINPTSGEAGDAKITVTTKANDTPDDRTASIIIKAGTASKTIAVSQKQKNALTVTASKFEIGAEGGEVAIEVKANIDFEYAIEESAKEWITYQTTRAMKTSTLVFKVAKNDDLEKREGKIAIKSDEFNEVITIYQAGAEPSIVISQNEYVVSSNSETIAVDVTSNVDVTVEITSDVDWIAENTTRATSTNTYYFYILPNDNYDQREAEIKFTNKANGLSETVKVVQAQKDALIVAKDNYTVSSDGDQIEIEVGHNVDFDIEIANDWITKADTRAFVTEKVVFNIAKNTGYDNREGTITFKSKDGALTQAVKVYQAQEDALIISKKDIVVSDESGTISFELQTNVDFKVSDPDVDWLRAVTTRGLTTHTLRYEIDANTSYNSREAHIVVTNTKTNASETITITQAQKDAIVLAKDSYTVSSDGDQIEIEVGHNVDFDIEIANEWITKADTRAFVTEKVVFNIAKNTGYDNRESTIIFKSKDGALTQAVKVYQTQEDALIISKKDIVVSDEGGTISFELQTNVDFKVSEPDVDWLRAVTTRGLNTHTLRYEADANTSYDLRETKIVVTDTKNNKSETITITQAQKDAIVLAKSEYEFGVDGGNLDFEIQTNVDVTVTISDNATDWIQQVETRGLETKALYFNIAACSAEADRECTITISGGNATQTITVRQSGLKEILEKEREALIAFYKATGGDNWTNNTNWCSDKPIDEWYGIQTTEFVSNGGRLWSILLADNNLVGTITDELDNLEKLDWVDLSGNYLESISIKSCHDLSRIYCNSNNNKLKLLNIEASTHITEIQCSNNDKLSGFSDFTLYKNLRSLLCENNNLNSINISGLSSLEVLWCGDNNLSSLDLSSCTNLYSLSCGNNNFTKLDLTNNPKLYYLACNRTPLVSINISNCSKLKNLYLGYNALTTLDVSNCAELVHLDCVENDLTSLDVSNNKKLTQICCDYNKLTSLKLNNPELETLLCRVNALTELDVRNSPKLDFLACEINALTSLDLSNNPKLRTLWCYDNQLSSLNTDGCTILETLLCCANNLSTIDVSDNVALQDFRPAYNNLKEIDVSMLTKLKTFFAGNNTGLGANPPKHPVKNNIKAFDLSNNVALEDFSCYDMNIEAIGLQNNIILKSFEGSFNPITTLDLSKNSALQELFICSIGMTELDISSNLEMTYLQCISNPQLTKIYIDPLQSFEYNKDATAIFYYKDGSEGDVSSPLYVSTDYSKDGEVKQLQAVTKGNGIDIVLMGDAYSDRLIADGTYDKTMNTAMEKFFEVEPYKSFREYFNVYSVTAVSKNEVYNDTSETALAGYFGGGTAVGGNDQRAFYYAQKAIGEERMDDALVVVMMNSTAYAGTCWMYSPYDGDWGNGVSVSYFPVGIDDTALAQVLHHEAAGHGFSKLGDEYAYEHMGAVPEWEVTSANDMAKYGWWKNIDFTSDPTQVKWKHFLTDSRYANEGLGVYEGAYTYWTGVWRPTYNSIMNTNVGGFNAPSREAIYYRIHKLAYGADWEYDYEEFVKWDAKNRATSATTRGIPYRLDIPEDFQPTHPPVVVKSSWREAKNNAPKKTTTRSAAGNAGSNLRKVSTSKAQITTKPMVSYATETLRDGKVVTITVDESGMTRRTVTK